MADIIECKILVLLLMFWGYFIVKPNIEKTKITQTEILTIVYNTSISLGIILIILMIIYFSTG